MAAVLYGAKGGNTNSDLYTIDTATGAQTSVGPIGHAVTALAFDPTNSTLYGVTSALSPTNPGSLITIDPGTGATIAVIADLTATDQFNDICFDPGGQLYGSVNGGGFYKIDKATGATTRIGALSDTPSSQLGGAGFGNGCEYRQSDDLLLVVPAGLTNSSPPAGWSTLWTADPTASPSATGVYISTVTFSSGHFTDGPAAAALAYSPDQTKLWVIENDFPSCWLSEIDTATGAMTPVGSLANRFDAIAAVEAAGAADHVAFAVQPTDSCVDTTIAPAVTVRIEDASNNLVTTSTAAVTVALTGPGSLSGTLTVNAVAGIATFNDLSVDTAGTGDTLDATSSGLTGDTSSAFDVTDVPANDLCANATNLSGVSGSITATNVCAGHEASDPLDVWFGITCKNTVFFKYTAAATAYLEITISRPGGSTMDELLAGIAHGSCGALTVENDDLVNTPSYRQTIDGAPPGTFGTPVTSGETVYVEVAVESTGDPGAFTLAWHLRTVTTYDDIDVVEQVGTDIIGPVDSHNNFADFYAMYMQTADGIHWIGYADVVARDGGDLATDIVCNVDMLAADGSGTWASTTVDTFNDQTDLLCLEDHAYWREGPYLVTDGTDVWALIVIGGGVGHTYFDGLHFCWLPEVFPSINIYHWNGGSWDKIGFDESAGSVALAGSNPVTSSNIGNLKYTASPNEPGVIYLAKSEQGDVSGRTWITKANTSGIVWTIDLASATSPDTAASSNLLLVNDGGSPVAFFVKPHTNYHNDPQTFVDFITDPVDMYLIDPGTGAATLAQSEPAPGGTSGAFDFAWASSPVFTDPMDSVVKYLIAGRARDSGVEEVWVYQVAADGTAPFEYMDNDIAHAVFASGLAANQSPAARIWQDPDNVWIPSFSRTIFQFDRQCFNSWGGVPTPGLVMPGTFLGATTYVRAPDIILVGDTFYGLAAWTPTVGTGNALKYTVFKLTIEPNLFCELGPDIGSVGPGVYLAPRIVG